MAATDLVNVTVCSRLNYGWNDCMRTKVSTYIRARMHQSCGQFPCCVVAGQTRFYVSVLTRGSNVKIARKMQ